MSAAQVALAWLLRRPAVTSLIVGARTGEQLRDNLAAINLQLSAAEHQRLERVSRPPLIYPFWHQRKTAADRLGSGDLSLITPGPLNFAARAARARSSARRVADEILA